MSRSTAVFLFTLSMAFAWFLFLLTPSFSGPNSRSFVVSEGEGFQAIAGDLAAQGLIRSRNTFMIYGLLTGAAHQLKPGTYEINAASSTPAILDLIERGPSMDVAITVPEGATVKDIDALFARSGILPAGSIAGVSARQFVSGYPFLEGQANLEGFLFPDTYRIFKNSETGAVMKKFLDTFRQKALPLLQANTSRRTFLEILTVASLLEKEAPDYRDRQIIAGIIYKRLAAGIPLQIDATITYAKCGGAFVTCADPKVYRGDLSVSSPYNTYLVSGLPPGPIGNPGTESIKAALNPVASDYLYYLSDPKTGRIIYSKTLDEQNDNRARYLGV